MWHCDPFNLSVYRDFFALVVAALMAARHIIYESEVSTYSGVCMKYLTTYDVEYEV